MSLPNHGANPHRLFAQLGIKQPSNILDFSENVNPAGAPDFIKNDWGNFLPLLQRYPDPEGEPFLSTVANYHGISTESIVLGNGAAEIFSLLATYFRGNNAIIVHPTFSEYEATLKGNDVEIQHVICEDIASWKLPLDELQHAMQNADVLYLCTPNNPTGVLPPKKDIQQLIASAKSANCSIVLDEAFIDFVDEGESFINAVTQNPHLIIVRSMTKMYAIAGIRLGYMVASSEVSNEIQRLAPHWHINGLAAEIGAHCLSKEQDVFRQQACEYAAKMRMRFQVFLRENNCLVTDSVTNYVSFQLPNSEQSKAFFMYLLERGIVLRHTENFIGMEGAWFRVGMKAPEAMERLEEAMTQWFQVNSSL
ncbi:pyridoxal phosphate-dependent class II aminotransferase [Viridibacillus sp. YIM B01967]|uniref:Aminotransferase n=1 Tax=Viridibacillus soli TaxID=2798301 RepID=A0ABS1H8D1_9BACL|nr:threonine-phosphate decarboxylase [Viridibacillus soli]MBK3495675.1 pyridoxal phosphate-dependent class II aminotransferase [Viridibacillus soli]